MRELLCTYELIRVVMRIERKDILAYFRTFFTVKLVSIGIHFNSCVSKLTWAFTFPYNVKASKKNYNWIILDHNFQPPTSIKQLLFAEVPVFVRATDLNGRNKCFPLWSRQDHIISSVKLSFCSSCHSKSDTNFCPHPHPSSGLHVDLPLTSIH